MKIKDAPVPDLGAKPRPIELGNETDSLSFCQSLLHNTAWLLSINYVSHFAQHHWLEPETCEYGTYGNTGKDENALKVWMGYDVVVYKESLSDLLAIDAE